MKPDWNCCWDRLRRCMAGNLPVPWHFQQTCSRKRFIWRTV